MHITNLLVGQGDLAGHVPGQGEHDGHEVANEGLVSAPLLLSQNVDLRLKSKTSHYTPLEDIRNITDEKSSEGKKQSH